MGGVAEQMRERGRSRERGNEVEKEGKAGELRQGNKFCSICAVLAANHAQKSKTREKGQENSEER